MRIFSYGKYLSLSLGILLSLVISTIVSISSLYAYQYKNLDDGWIYSTDPIKFLSGTYTFGPVAIGYTSGAINPTYKLDVIGGYINTSSGFCISGSCIDSWDIIQGWRMGGNIGITGTDFIGTQDVADFVIKTNNIERIRINSSGSVVGGGNSFNFSGGGHFIFGDTAGDYLEGENNIALGGLGAGSYMGGIKNTALGGIQAGSYLSGNNNSVFGGELAGRNMNGILNTVIGGSSAGWFMGGTNNTIVGGEIGGWFGGGLLNTLIGGNVIGYGIMGERNVAIGGWGAGNYMSGMQNVAIGGQDVGNAMFGINNVAIGGDYAGNMMEGYWNVAMGGHMAGAFMSGNYNIAIGTYAGCGMTVGDNNLFLGSYASGVAYRDNQFSIGNILYGSGMGTGGLLNGLVGIGTRNPTYKLDVIGGYINTSSGFCISGSCIASWNSLLPNATSTGNTLRWTGTGWSDSSSKDILVNGVLIGKGSGSISTNTAFGVSVFLSNTTGNNNVAMGLEALTYNTNGSFNTANGVGALARNTIGSRHSAIGYQAANRIVTTGDAQSNTVFGYQALYGGSSIVSSNTANDNVAIGYQSLYGTPNIASEGIGNVAVGNKTLSMNTDGPWNVAIGTEVLSSNTRGGVNTAIGHQSMFGNVFGSNNVTIGSWTLFSNYNGSNNVAIGDSALYMNNGGYNVALGQYALDDNITGSHNTALGYSTDVSTGNLSNASAIGANALVTASNTMVLGSVNGVNGATSDVQVVMGSGAASSDAYKLDVVGNVGISGFLNVLGNISALTPSSSGHVATKGYVDAVVSASAGVPNACISVFTGANTLTGLCTGGYIMIWGMRGSGQTVTENIIHSDFGITAPQLWWPNYSPMGISYQLGMANTLTYKGVSISLGTEYKYINVNGWNYTPYILVNGSPARSSGYQQTYDSTNGFINHPWGMSVCCK